MARSLNKSGKKLVKKKGKDGRVRAYWMGHKDEKKGGKLNSANPDGERPGFLRRHGGKLLAGAALLGVAALNRHKIAGAVGGARLGHGMASAGGAGLAGKAHAAFQGAKAGYRNHQGMDRADGMMGRMAFRGAGAIDQAHAAMGHRLQQYRSGHGGALMGHMTNVVGGMALSHLGAKFGQTAGTAIGSLAGPGGAAVGGWLGGHAGEWLANRHGAQHVQRAAGAVQERVQGNHVPNQQAVPVNFGSGASHASPLGLPSGRPHTAVPQVANRAQPNHALAAAHRDSADLDHLERTLGLTPHAHTPSAPPRNATPHQAASHAAHTAPASQTRSFSNPAAPLQSSRTNQQHMANAMRDRQNAERSAARAQADDQKARERAHRMMTGKRWWQR